MAFTTIQENTWSKIGISPPININASGTKTFKSRSVLDYAIQIRMLPEKNKNYMALTGNSLFFNHDRIKQNISS